MSRTSSSAARRTRWLSRFLSAATVGLLLFLVVPATATADPGSSRPSAPIVTSANFPECTPTACTASGRVGDIGVFTLSALDSDVTSYRYGWSASPINPIATEEGKPVTLELPVREYGMNTLYVQAFNQVGVSPTSVYSFVVGRLAGPVAGWGLEARQYGTPPLANIVVDGPALTVEGSVSWTPDVRLIGASTAGFSGTGSLVTTESVVDTAESFSMAAWVRLEGTDSDARVAGFEGVNQSAMHVGYSADSDRWYLAMPEEDSVTGGTWARAESDQTIKANQWTHLAVAVDRSDQLARLFVNGVEAGSTAVPAGWTATGPFRVGDALSGDASMPWHGQVAQVRLYDRAITAGDITIGYDDHRPLMTPTLVAAWDFNIDCCGEVWDNSGWGNDLETQGGTQFTNGRDWNYGLGLNGVDGLAQSATAVVRTDESFAITAWARLDSNQSDSTVLSTEAATGTSLSLGYDTAADRWQVALPSTDGSTGSHTAESATAPEAGQWYHLAAIYDAANDELRLYVDGNLESTVAAPINPLHVDGRLLLGACGSTNGDRWAYMHGVIDDVYVYSGVVTEEMIADIASR